MSQRTTVMRGDNETGPGSPISQLNCTISMFVVRTVTLSFLYSLARKSSTRFVRPAPGPDAGAGTALASRRGTLCSKFKRGSERAGRDAASVRTCRRIDGHILGD